MMSILGSIFLLTTSCLAQMVQHDNGVNPIEKEDIHFKVRINLNLSDNSSEAIKNIDFGSMYDDQVVLKLPRNYSDTGKPVRLVYLAHGAGGGVTDSTWFFNHYSLPDSLLENGYACFDVNGGPAVQNMGGSWVVQSAFKAYEYIRQHYNVYDEIFVGGFSMGGLSSTNFVNRHSNIVLAHAMYSPVLDLYGQAWKNPWSKTTKQAIAKAYDFVNKTGEKWEPAKVVGWNPLLTDVFNNDGDTVKLYPVPVKIWHGTHDATVRVNASRKFHKYIQNAGGCSELRELDSDDHGLSCGNAYMNHELLVFLKMFDQ